MGNETVHWDGLTIMYKNIFKRTFDAETLNKSRKHCLYFFLIHSWQKSFPLNFKEMPLQETPEIAFHSFKICHCPQDPGGLPLKSRRCLSYLFGLKFGVSRSFRVSLLYCYILGFHIKPTSCLNTQRIRNGVDMNIYDLATFSLPICLPSSRIRRIRQANPQLFQFALQSGNFGIRQESEIMWILGYFADSVHLPSTHIRRTRHALKSVTF